MLCLENLSCMILNDVRKLEEVQNLSCEIIMLQRWRIVGRRMGGGGGDMSPGGTSLASEFIFS